MSTWFSVGFHDPTDLRSADTLPPFHLSAGRAARIDATQMSAPLPAEVLDEPSFHPDCCHSLSKQLLTTLADLFAHTPGVVLSIGSGAGLLEALLLARNAALNLQAIEVQDDRGPRVNKYLPDGLMHYVAGSYDVHPGAATATTWLLVYPREPKLVARYLARLRAGRVQQIVCISPRSEWPRFEEVLRTANWGEIIEVTESGLRTYEGLFVARTS